MDREKEIQEMARVVCLTSNCVDNFSCDNCEYTTESCRTQCCFGRNAEVLYEAGYRKADEVRKETASDIIELIRANDAWNISDEAIKQIAKEYGINLYK